MTDTAPGSAPPGAPDDWVPVEHRFAGLDRRTIAPALFVLVLAFICATVLPAIDAAIEPDNPVKAGDVMNLGSGLTLVPAEGWNVVTGLRVSDQTNVPATGTAPPVELSNGSVVFRVTLGPFRGDANQLLDQTNALRADFKDIDEFATTGDRVSVTTRQGATGVVETFTGSEVQGKIAAFVYDGTGVQITALGLPDDLAAHENDIRDMVESIEQPTGGQS
jgi:hypothetical protein